MRLSEFSHKVDFEIKQFPMGGFRIAVLSDLEIDREALPELYQRIFKYPNQIGVIDVGEDLKGYPNIENVFLAKEARRQGLGTMVYNKAMDFAKEKLGAKGISSARDQRNINSDAFWKKFRQGSQGKYDIRHDAFESFLGESANDYVYHVTFSDNVPKIQKAGLVPFQTSNWTTGDGERYNKEGGVFAFAHPEDAFKWAFKTNWEFKRPVSIIRLHKTDAWHKDPSADIMLQMGKGDALRSMSAIGPEYYVDSFDFEDFGTPVEKNMSQDEWISGIVSTLSEAADLTDEQKEKAVDVLTRLYRRKNMSIHTAYDPEKGTTITHLVEYLNDPFLTKLVSFKDIDLFVKYASLYNKFQPTTAFKIESEMSDLNQMMKNPEYYSKEKGWEFEVIQMSPFMYQLACERGFGEKGFQPEENLVWEYALKTLEGSKMPAPSITWIMRNGEKHFEQEGRHRSYVAQLLGINYMPVIVSTRCYPVPNYHPELEKPCTAFRQSIYNKYKL